MRFSALAFLLAVSSFSAAAVIWSTAASDSVNGVAVAGGNAIFTSYDGGVYAAGAGTGAVSWAYESGSRILLAPETADNRTVAVATAEGKLVLLNAENGKVLREISLNKTPLSLAAGDGRVFLGFNDSATAFSIGGKRLWSRPFREGVGPIGYSTGTAYFVSGAKLYAVNMDNGITAWSSEMEESFLSRPAEYEGNVYVGAADGRLYSFDYFTGKRQWAYKTGGWVMSTPVATSKSVYFGSNDGYFYSLSLSGQLNWKFKTGEAIWSQPIMHESNGRLLAVFGSNDGNIYALDTQNGQQAWSFSTYGKPGSPVEYDGAFIFGTDKGKVYSLGASPVCGFGWPESGGVVGNWSVDVEGKAHSDAGLERVEVRADGGPWMAAVGTDRWYAPVDFTLVKPGAATVECRAIDSAGRNEAGDYSAVTLVVSENAPLQQMAVSSPLEAAYNESFLISAKDSRGGELHGITVKILDTSVVKDSPLRVVLGKAGPVKISLEKPGFEPVRFTVAGKGGESLALPLLLAAVAAAVAAYFLFGRKFLAFIKK